MITAIEHMISTSIIIVQGMVILFETGQISAHQRIEEARRGVSVNHVEDVLDDGGDGRGDDCRGTSLFFLWPLCRGRGWHSCGGGGWDLERGAADAIALTSDDSVCPLLLHRRHRRARKQR